MDIFTSPSNLLSGFPVGQREWLVPTRVKEDEWFLPAMMLRVPDLLHPSIMEVICWHPNYLFIFFSPQDNELLEDVHVHLLYPEEWLFNERLWLVNE